MVDEWNMSIKHWWNTDRGKLKYLEWNLSQYHFVDQKSHVDWRGDITQVAHRETWAMAWPSAFCCEHFLYHISVWMTLDDYIKRITTKSKRGQAFSDFMDDYLHPVIIIIIIYVNTIRFVCDIMIYWTTERIFSR